MLPPAGSDVTISVPASDPTILFTSAAGVVQINSLTTNEPLTLQGGTLQVATTIQSSKDLVLSGGVIKNARIQSLGTGVFFAISGRLDGVTLDQDLTISNDSGIVHIENGITLNGANLILGSQPLGLGGEIHIRGVQTISGSGEILFGTVADQAGSQNLYIWGNGVVPGLGILTIGPGITLRNRQAVSLGSFTDDSLVNLGTMIFEAQKNNFIQVGNFTDKGKISVESGVELNIVSPLILQDFGTIQTAANSVLTLSGGLIGNAKSGASFRIQGTTVFGGMEKQ